MKQTSCKIAVLVSGSGTNLQAIIDAVHAGKIHGKIVAVLSDRGNILGLERAEKANIPTKVVNYKSFENAEIYNNTLLETIQSVEPDLIVLAGYMRIIGDQILHAYPWKILNIHPSLLPKYPGLHTHKRAIEAGDAEHGTSVHFVTGELDGGPIIAQAKVKILPNEDETSLKSRVQAEEHRLYPQVIAWFCDGRLQVKNHCVLLDGAPTTC